VTRNCDPLTSNPVVAVLPVKGWYAVFTPWETLSPDLGLHPYAAPIEHATVHADGVRRLWIAEGDSVRVAGNLGNFRYHGTVQAVPGAVAVYLRPEFDRAIPVQRDGVSLTWTSGEPR
jgi:hypothetical protein